MNTNTDTEKSNYLLKQARSAYRSLDIPGAYHLVVDSISADPGNFKAYFTLKNVMSTVAFSYPEIFDGERIKELFRRSLAIDPQVPVLWNQLSRLHKILEDYEMAEETAFRSVVYGNTRSHWFNQMYSLFDLGYVHKNLGRMDIFTGIVFSIPWNVNIHRRIKAVAIPRDVLKKRIVKIDFNIPPIKFIRDLDERRFHLLSLEDSTPAREQFLKLLTALDRKKTQFSFLHIPPLVFMAGLSREQKHLTRLIPSDSASCYAALQIGNDFMLHICPAMEREIKPILSSLTPPWKIVIEKYSFCECR